MGTETKLNCYSKDATQKSSKAIKCSCGSIQQNITLQTVNGHVQEGVNAKVKAKKLVGLVPFVPIHVDENNVIDGAKEILKVIRPQWNLNEVEFKKFTDGITNKLVGCWLNTSSEESTILSSTNINNIHTNGTSNCENDMDPNASNESNMHDDNNDSGNLSDTDDTDTETTDPDVETSMSGAMPTNPSSTISTSNVVLVRVYGNKTDLLIDRKAEMRNILLLHSYGFAPPLYATFKNGLAYDYVPGVTLNTNNVMKPEIWSLVARRMAEMHRVVKFNKNINANDDNGVSPIIPMLWKKMQSFFDLVPEKFSDANKHKRFEGTFLPISRMRQEFVALFRRLETLGSPIVFAHNDLLLGNVIFTESLNTVNFIDYEYADYNFQAFDIGNHFAEFAGVDEVDYRRYPTREFQLEWLRVYLEAYLKRTDISDSDVERLYVQVNQFALAAHFFWTIWSLIQAEHSKIDFDYVDYAFVRYNEYLARKDEFLALDINSSVRS